jgi:hypothetical protein
MKGHLPIYLGSKTYPTIFIMISKLIYSYFTTIPDGLVGGSGWIK